MEWWGWGPYVGCWDIMFPPSYFCLLDANLQPTGLRQQYNGFSFWHFLSFDISLLLTFSSFWAIYFWTTTGALYVAKCHCWSPTSHPNIPQLAFSLSQGKSYGMDLRCFSPEWLFITKALLGMLSLSLCTTALLCNDPTNGDGYSSSLGVQVLLLYNNKNKIC